MQRAHLATRLHNKLLVARRHTALWLQGLAALVAGEFNAVRDLLLVSGPICTNCREAWMWACCFAACKIPSSTNGNCMPIKSARKTVLCYVSCICFCTRLSLMQDKSCTSQTTHNQREISAPNNLEKIQKLGKQQYWHATVPFSTCFGCWKLKWFVRCSYNHYVVSNNLMLRTKECCKQEFTRSRKT